MPRCRVGVVEGGLTPPAGAPATEPALDILANAIRDALQAVDPDAYVARFVPGEETTIDGYFDLRRAAKLVLSSISKIDPSERL
jgi:hypothetical protein